MKRGKWKEAILLLVPVVAIICVAFWWQQREKRDAVLESGPLRLEVESIEKVIPTPAEVAEGYDTKYVVSFRRRGKNPLPSPNDLERYHLPKSISARDIRIEAREKNKWRPLAPDTSLPVRVLDNFVSQQVSSNQISILLPLATFPDKEIRLQYEAYMLCNVRVGKGEVQSRGQFAKFSPSLGSRRPDTLRLELTSPLQTLVVHKAGELTPIPSVSRVCPISIKEARVVRWKPISKNKSTEIVMGLKIEDWQTSATRTLTWRTFAAHLVDQDGQIYSTSGGITKGAHNESSASSDQGTLNFPTTIEGEKSYPIKIYTNLRKIPASAGQITYKAKLSVNESWPLPISIVVRERDDWTMRSSKSLTLQSITAQPVTQESAKFAVKVVLQYKGTQRLISHPRNDNYFYSRWGTGMSELGIDYPSLLSDIRVSGKRLFVTDWSQRIEGTRASLLQRRALLSLDETDIKVKKVGCNEFCTVDYEVDLSKQKALPQEMIFKADIGVEGDGFLPVSVPLSPALVATTAAAPLP